MKIIWLLILLLIVNGLTANVFVLNTVSQTISKIDLTNGTVNNAFAYTGLFPNKMATTDEYIYLTNSGDNNIRKIRIETGATILNIQLESYSNPYDILISDNYAYVTGMLTNKVYKIDLNTDSTVAELSVGVAPLGITAYNGLLYVANSGYQYPSYLPGELTVIDLDTFSVLTTIAVPLSPYRMLVDNEGLLHLVCSGNYDDVWGEIALIDTNTLQVIDNIPLTFYPTNIVMTPGNRVYVANAFGGGLFAYDLPDLEIVHDDDNLFSEGGSALAVDSERLWIADAGDFNSNSVISVYDLTENLLTNYQTALGAVDIAFKPVATTVTDNIIIPPIPMLSCYPNPFQNYTEIRYNNPSDHASRELSISIYNLKGQKVRELSTSYGSISWNGKDMSGNRCRPGVYLLKIVDDEGFSQTGKITLIR